jgi:glycosyltransferase involved in cell wall biosynthesis
LLPRNLGQQGAIRTGLLVAKGDVVVVLDADLQDPPEAIPSLIEHLGSEAVDAVFAARSGCYQSTFRMCCSWSYRWLIWTVTHVPRGAGGYVAMSRRMVDRLSTLS